mgnify:CR=1 FL=1
MSKQTTDLPLSPEASQLSAGPGRLTHTNKELARRAVTGCRAAPPGALADRGTSSSAARSAASAAVGALNAALLEWADGDEPDLGTAIDSALRVLGGGAL